MPRLPTTYVLEQQTHESRGRNPHKYCMVFETFNTWSVVDSYTVEVRLVKYEKEKVGSETRIVEVTRTLENTRIKVDQDSKYVYMISALLHGYGDTKQLDSYANALWWEHEIVNEKPGVYAKYFPEEYKLFRSQLERSRMRVVSEVMES